MLRVLILNLNFYICVYDFVLCFRLYEVLWKPLVIICFSHTDEKQQQCQQQQVQQQQQQCQQQQVQQQQQTFFYNAKKCLSLNTV